MITWCLIPNLILYGLASLCYLLLTLGRRFRLAEAASVLTWFGLFLQAIYLVHLLLNGTLVFLSFLSFGTVLLFLWLELRYRWLSLGSFFVPLGLLLFLLGLQSFAPHLLFHTFPGIKVVHVVLALGAVLFLVGSFLLGIVFWIHEQGLRQKQWSFLAMNFPPLVLNEQNAVRWLRIGFLFLSLVLLSGALLLPGRTPLTFHPILAIVAWLAYAVLLNRSWNRFGSRKILLVSTLGLVSLFGSYLWTLSY